VEVVVNQTRHDHVVAGADDLLVGISGAEVLVFSHLDDQAVLLQHRAVGDHDGGVRSGYFGDNVLAAHEARSHNNLPIAVQRQGNYLGILH